MAEDLRIGYIGVGLMGHAPPVTSCSCACPPASRRRASCSASKAYLRARIQAWIHVDSTTADPNSTRRISHELEAQGCAMVDAPMSRTPKEPEEGKLNTFLGGPRTRELDAFLSAVLPLQPPLDA